MAGAEELLERMLQEVFNEPDPQRRAAAIADVFTDDVVFTDDGRTARGREDLAATVTGLLAQGPGLVFTPAGPFRGVGDLGMRPWRLGPPGAEPVLGGLDVAQVADGRIARLWTVLDA
ncbi:nuclear transport factor 2 family protein [Geodermatophilus nigrescens]|uniref:SnoaL-like domain-containing protein n=1 Tax=Geodermatophilus nigrescens TaxID=1070870 RepID=A0A1M5LKL7_9ACTN|nr:nuclear transport factor 2 family protein [Geodermatophilus nigrescens]SHG65581.1 SnoaL-like domain-containing protein [Geodermatophilus nigrescens]